MAHEDLLNTTELLIAELTGLFAPLREMFIDDGHVELVHQLDNLGDAIDAYLLAIENYENDLEEYENDTDESPEDE